MVETKRCTGCGSDKQIEEFSRFCYGAGGRRARCRKCTAQYRKQSRQDNYEKYITRQREYNQRYYKKLKATNPDRLKQKWQAQYERRRKDKKLVLARRLQDSIRKALQRNGRRSWESSLGYAPEDLAQHIERQFAKGMSWKNMGQWHIDHIVPVAEFDFATPDDAEFKACFALSNLRPLWKRDNLTKQDQRQHLL